MGKNDLAPGAVLMGRYVIEGELGAGGFGQVFRARQEPLGRAVAIKVLHASAGALAPGTRERFFREAHLAQRLEHPNTVRVLDIGTTDGGLPFIVLELLRGTTLGDYLARFGPMPDAQVHRVATQILKSLMEAHAFGVVHRDIKPANIFITSHPGEPLFVKVLDFGIAKDLFASPESAPKVVARTVAIQRANATPGASGSLTSQSQTLGTPRYMSPEQIVGETIGPWTDVYAVGLVMAEMLTASPVFEGESAVEILLERATGSATPLKMEVTRSRLYHTIARATAPLPHDRFHSAEQMLASMGSEEQVSGPVPVPLPAAPAVAAAVTGPAAGPTALLTAPMQRAPAHLPAPPPPRPAPKSNGLVKLAVGGGTLLAAGVVAGAIVLSQRAKGSPKEKTSHSAAALASTAASPAPSAPVPSPTAEKTAAKPSVPISKRTVPVLSAAEVERRLLLAGFTLQSPPKEEKNGFGRTINAPVIRGECFGSVNYFDYKDPKNAEAIQQSTSSMAEKAPPTLRTGGRMISVTIVARAGKESCDNDLLDALTR